MFENLQDLKKKALIELKKQTAGEKRGKRIASSKLRKIMEEEISFIKNRMHERIRQKLLDVTSHLFRIKLEFPAKRYSQLSQISSMMSSAKSTAMSERKLRGRSMNSPY